MRWIYPLGALLLAALLAACGTSPAPTALRLGVSLDAATLADFEPAVKALDEQHPEWQITLEQIPQADRLTKLNAQIASGTLPDLVLNDGVSVQQFIRQGAFADLTELVARDNVKLDAYFPDTVKQFAYGGKQWGLPTVAAPEVVFFNKAMFDTAGLAYPTDEWTFEQMRSAARTLTLELGRTQRRRPPVRRPEYRAVGLEQQPRLCVDQSFCSALRRRLLRQRRMHRAADDHAGRHRSLRLVGRSGT